MSKSSKYPASTAYIIANEVALLSVFIVFYIIITPFIKERKDKSQMAHELLVCG